MYEIRKRLKMFHLELTHEVLACYELMQQLISVKDRSAVIDFFVDFFTFRSNSLVLL